MARIENGWFYEFIKVYHGQAMSLKVEEVILEKKSKFQDILIFKNKEHGNVLVLDGCIQLTNKDECAYQEMISFLPLNSHPNPKKVLVIGAGDGGVIREVAKHPLVESIVQCEIDEDVVKYSKEFLPKLSCGYSSSKSGELHIGCGKEFLKQYREEFDVIITDSSDSDGPAAALFQKEYYERVFNALKPGGIMCGEGECPWLDKRSIGNVIEACKSFFPVVQYATANVPTYPCGEIGFVVCSRNAGTKFCQPVTKFTKKQLSSFNLQYYNSDVHSAAFAVPNCFKKVEDDYNGSDEINNQNWFWQNRTSSCQSFGLVKREIMSHERMKDKDIVVFKNSIYGNILVIDEIMQYTEKDQPLYEESMAHLSLNLHPSPNKVLIIGGLSGGIIHEVAKYQAVQTIILLEQDKEIVDMVQKFFPRSAAGYSNPKLLGIQFTDYKDFLQRNVQQFDVIITVPIELFNNVHLSESIKNALKPGGIYVSKVPNFWSELTHIQKRVKEERALFPVVKLAYICIPTSPYGQVTFVLRCLNKETCFDTPFQHLSDEQLSDMIFYNTTIHPSSFALPEFVRKAIDN